MWATLKRLARALNRLIISVTNLTAAFSGLGFAVAIYRPTAIYFCNPHTVYRCSSVGV